MDQNQSPLTWVCECSHVNSEANTTCEICRLSNPAAQDHAQPQHPPQLNPQNEEPQNQAPLTWVCECSHVNSEANTTCEICRLSNPAAQDHAQPQHPPEPTPQTEAPHPQDQAAPSEEVPKFHNIYDYGPVQIVGTYPNTGDLVPKSALHQVISENWKNRDTPLIIISQLGIVNQGKSLYGNILNQKLLKGKPFTPFPVGTTTKGLTMFSNPIPLEGDPNTQIVHLDVEGADGVTDEPQDIQKKALKRLYVLSMLVSSVVFIHLGSKPAQTEVTLLSEACDTVLLLKSKLYVDLPKIYLLIREAEDDQSYKTSIENLRQWLKNQLKDEILQHCELLPRGKLTDAFLDSNPFDYSKVGPGYQAQMDKIINGLKDHKKKHPIQPNQLMKISDFPSIIQELGVTVLNNSEYAPYLERSMDYLRTQELSKACQKHQNLYAQECKTLADDLSLTQDTFTQQLSATQTRHRTNFLQEAETISQKKLNELPLLQSFMSQFDIGMKVNSFEQVFAQNKLADEKQQAEKQKHKIMEQEAAQQQAASKLEAEKFVQERQKKVQEFKQEMDKQKASHQQKIRQYKAQRAKELAQVQEQQKQRQKQMEAETAQAKANQQKQEAQLKQEEQKQREEDQSRKAEELEKAKQENEQKVEEEKAKIDKETAETQKKAKEQEQKRQEERKKQEEQQAQEKAQKQQEIQEASQDDSDDDSVGDCCNIF